MIEVNFNSDGLVPAICRDENTGEVLMLAWMNKAALDLTLNTGDAHFWSRSRQELWHKGETSGNYLRISQIRLDCDSDAILLDVSPAGPACHTGSTSCFYRTITGDDVKSDMSLGKLQNVIKDRKSALPEDSYTAKLLVSPKEKILQKIGEEAVEVILASTVQGRERLIEETSDLFYHVLVLLAREEIELKDIYDELARRHQ